MREVIIGALLMRFAAAPLAAQDTNAARGRGAAPRRAGAARPWTGAMDSTRARELYVSRDAADLRGCAPAQCQRDIERKRVTDSIYAAHAPGNYEFRRITYRSRPDGLEIPAYLYSPIDKGAARHAALVWVHQGLHADWDLDVFPWVIEAVKQFFSAEASPFPSIVPTTDVSVLGHVVSLHSLGVFVVAILAVVGLTALRSFPLARPEKRGGR